MLDTKRRKYNRTKRISLEERFEEFILDKDHPCVMAQTVFKMEDVQIKSYDSLGTLETAKNLYKDIQSYLESYDFNSNRFETLLAVFPSMEIDTEIEFEKLLWKQLNHISEIDNQEWDNTVSNDPNNKDFSFSIFGKAFYMVGMHPKSSRSARKSPYPAIAFNLHEQFEKLREMKVYDNVRDKIRERDKELQGDVNPMLQDFGRDSEAKQYSGRKVDDSWKCPFHNSNS